MQHHSIDASGVRLHVVEQGSGPAVLFCHGFPAIWASWRFQMAAVAQAGWRALALDMRGYGDSDAPIEAELYTPLHGVGDLVGLLDALELPSAVLVGHDFGANLAWNAALLRPDRFTAVFAISVPYAPFGRTNFLDQLRAASRDDFYMFAQMRPEADEAWADATTTIPACYYWTSGQAPEAARWSPFDPARGLLRPAPEPLHAIDAAYLGEAVAAFARIGFHGALNYYRAIDPYFRTAARALAGAKITQPSFFLTGGRDGLNELRRPSEPTLRAALPGLAGFQTIEAAGHWPQLETPEATNAALLGFLGGLDRQRLEGAPPHDFR